LGDLRDLQPALCLRARDRSSEIRRDTHADRRFSSSPRPTLGHRRRDRRIVRRVIRRAVDIVVSSLALLLASPVLAVAALAVRLESPGPIVYRQMRAGLHGHEFEVLKLRTMVDGAEHIGAGLAINENDSRITRVGALLRRTSIDELPNLLNVLRGEMSLIGPRPTLPVQVAQYTPRQRGRLAIKPGITGWAQIHGRATLPWPERIELDLYYIEHRSLALDVRILQRTVAIVLGGDDLYKGAAGGWEGKL
jgi:lipopolysaccharide/colanic/teichoic acid biosynthesis glycosyltransferase